MYTANLGRVLSDQLTSSLRFFGSSFSQRDILKAYAHANRVDAAIYPVPVRYMSSLIQHGMPIDLLVPGISVFHTWDWYLPKSIKAKQVITIHDVALFKYKDIAHPDIQEHHQRVMDQIKIQHPSIIAVSESTKQDIVELFAINPDEITVIHEALPEEQCIKVTDEFVDAVKTKLHLQKPYFLIVGTQEPRKNIPNQIAAWRKYRDDFDLVLVGKSGWETLTEEPGMHIVGYRNGEELAALYRGASVMLYASLAEGFGLPILEAFYHHTPVVTSNCSSLAEIGQDAVIQVEPTSVNEIEQGIQQALDKHTELTTKCITRLADFSWEKTARQTIDVYNKAVNNS
jgi:glycosyltransferase involved in cell wall biosynthesis